MSSPFNLDAFPLNSSELHCLSAPPQDVNVQQSLPGVRSFSFRFTAYQTPAAVSIWCVLLSLRRLCGCTRRRYSLGTPLGRCWWRGGRNGGCSGHGD